MWADTYDVNKVENDGYNFLSPPLLLSQWWKINNVVYMGYFEASISQCLSPKAT